MPNSAGLIGPARSMARPVVPGHDTAWSEPSPCRHDPMASDVPGLSTEHAGPTRARPD
jgi:hypothetical protein